MAASPLERIGDHSLKIANVASKMEAPIQSSVMEGVENLSISSMELVKQAIEALFNSDTTLANRVIDNAGTLHDQAKDLDSSILKLEAHETMISLRTVVDSLTRIGDYGTNIAEIAINSAISSK